MTNEHTASFRRVSKVELEPRIASLYQNLGKWIGDPQDNEICQEYEHWGRSRFRQEIPFSEIVYVLMLTKKHLRKFIREHGLVTFSGDHVTPDELVPVELYAIQELNYLVGDFFDRALYFWNGDMGVQFFRRGLEVVEAHDVAAVEDAAGFVLLVAEGKPVGLSR